MFYALAVVLVLILDQWLKYWVTISIPLNIGSQELIPGIVSLVNIHNYGAAFGILDSGDWRWAFVAIAAVFTAFAVYALKKGLIQHAIGRWAMVGVLAGAIGNCIDRALYGYVVDMFKLEFMNYAIFNVADMFISCCGVLFCLYIIFSGSGKKVPAAEDEGAHSRTRAKQRRHDGGRARAAREEEEPDVAGGPVSFRRAKDEDARTYIPRKAGAQPPAQPAKAAKSAPERAQRAESVQRAERAQDDTPRAERAPKPARPEAKPPESAKKEGEEFSLEDILAEFGGK